MSKNNAKVAREVVTEMIEAGEGYYRTTLAEEDREILITAGEDGRFDIESGTITIGLLAPIKLENGSTIESLTLEEPDADQLAKAQGRKDDNDLDAMLRVIAGMSGQALGVVRRLKMRDLKVIGAAANFFG
jgi:hypothetical protein